MTLNRPARPATAARIYDYFLGGTHNFPADREAAETIIAMFPSTRTAAQVNRAFLRRTVRFVGKQGVIQFLDIGSGIPTEGNVHEIAQEAEPQARVVYVDIDPVAVAESQEMLEHNEFAVAIHGDACEPRSNATPTIRRSTLLKSSRTSALCRGRLLAGSRYSGQPRNSRKRQIASSGPSPASWRWVRSPN